MWVSLAAVLPTIDYVVSEQLCAGYSTQAAGMWVSLAAGLPTTVCLSKQAWEIFTGRRGTFDCT